MVQIDIKSSFYAFSRWVQKNLSSFSRFVPQRHIIYLICVVAYEFSCVFFLLIRIIITSTELAYALSTNKKDGLLRK